MKGKSCESPPCLFLEFLMDLTKVSGERESLNLASVKIEWRSNLWNPVKTPPPKSLILRTLSPQWTLKWWQMKEIIHSKDPTSDDSTFPQSLFLESWRTWRYKANLQMMSYDMYQPFEVPVKIPSKSNIRNPILKVPSWSLGGHGGS